jgi:hypothetical protein
MKHKKQDDLSGAFFFQLLNPSGRNKLRGFTQALREISNKARNKKLFWGVERVLCVTLKTSLPSESRLPRKCEILNIS